MMQIESEKDSLKRIEEENKLIDEFIGNDNKNVTNKRKCEYKFFINGFLEYAAIKHNLVLTKSDIKLNC